MSVRLFIGNLPYSATEAELREHLSASAYPRPLSCPSTAKPAAREASRSWTTPIARVAEEAIQRFDQQPFKGRRLAVSEARPREERGPGGPRPGGFGGPPRPGGFVGPRPAGPRGRRRAPRPGGFGGPRPVDGGAASRARQRNFGPDAPPKHKRKPHMDRREQGPRPIKERPVGRLYENDEDWRRRTRTPRIRKSTTSPRTRTRTTSTPKT